MTTRENAANISENLRIAVFAKFPPIQGGVSTDVWEFCEAASKEGLLVHVITNALEVEAGIRCVLSEADQQLLEQFKRKICFHSTSSQRSNDYIPYANPFLSKLIGLGYRVFSEFQFDLVVGWYLEPYGTAAATLSQLYNLPLFIRTAGSDIGRLSSHPNLRELYQHYLKRAYVVFGGPPGSNTHSKLTDLGVEPNRVVNLKVSNLPPAFRPTKTLLPLDWRSAILMEQETANLKDREIWNRYYELNDVGCFYESRPTIGIYGKVGSTKGTKQLFQGFRDLVERCKKAFNVLWAASGVESEIHRFFDEASQFKFLHQKILVLPPLPPWRIPQFLARCDITCVLEHDFPVQTHSPRLPREILAVGSCLVISKEVAEKQRFSANLVHMKNCVIVESPKNQNELSKALALLIEFPEMRQDIAKHGYFLSKTVEKFVDPGNPMVGALNDLYIQRSETI